MARYVAIALSLAVILVILGLFLTLSAAASGVSFDMAGMWAALAAALLLGLVVAALGLSIATWLARPGAALPITIAIVVLMFFLEIFAPILNLPSAVLNLFVFHLYGKPMTEGVKWGSTITLVTVTLILCAVSLLGLNRRDIAK